MCRFHVYKELEYVDNRQYVEQTKLEFGQRGSFNKRFEALASVADHNH